MSAAFGIRSRSITPRSARKCWFPTACFQKGSGTSSGVGSQVVPAWFPSRELMGTDP